jgi:hypothetical protein
MPALQSSPGDLTPPASQVFAVVMGALLVLCWMLGGVTVDHTPADELLQLAALPVLAWAIWRMSGVPLSRTTIVALAFVAAVVALPLFQLMPLPDALATWGAGRQGIAADLAAAGLPATKLHASLSVVATERSLWSLLPAVALFTGALVLPAMAARRLLQLVLALVLASAAFAFFQLSLPDGSSLLLYTAWGRNFGGFFVNPNHQGNALALGAVIAGALFIDGRRRAGEHGKYRYWLYAAISTACVAMVPLAQGSAAMLLVVVGLVAVAVMMGAFESKSLRRNRQGQLRVVAAVLLAMVVLSSAFAWKRVDENRRIFATTTVHIGEAFAPLGTGVGTFVPIYAQYQDLHHARTETINHAHNEYAQWWLEGGVPALVVLAFGLGLFCWTGWHVLARMQSSRLRTIGAAAWVGLLLFLLHSVVDFPLRTTTLMATAGLFAGLLFNAVNVTRRSLREHAMAPMGDDQSAMVHRSGHNY